MTIITSLAKCATDPTLIHAGTRTNIAGMEKTTRTLTKAVTWQMMGFVVMAAVNYLYIGDWRAGVGLSALLTLVGLVGYYLHERVWARIGWGRM